MLDVYLRSGFSLSLELTGSFRLAGHQAPVIPLFLFLILFLPLILRNTLYIIGKFRFYYSINLSLVLLAYFPVDMVYCFKLIIAKRFI